MKCDFCINAHISQADEVTGERLNQEDVVCLERETQASLPIKRVFSTWSFRTDTEHLKP